MDQPTVRNLATGYISTQYHLVYDDWFETIHATGDPPKEWDKLCIYQRFQVIFDKDNPVPKLAPEWDEVRSGKAAEDADRRHAEMI